MTNTTGLPAEDLTVRYVIDSALSKFTIRAYKSGLLSAFGHNPVIAIAEFSGEAQVGENLERASLTMTIDAASLKVANDVSDKDRAEIERIMHEQVLQTEQYPEIVYIGSKVSASKLSEGSYWVALSGELTLHGVMRGLTVTARVAVNGETLKASGDFSLLQSQFEIQPISVAGGALKVKDELKATFEIVAKKQG